MRLRRLTTGFLAVAVLWAALVAAAPAEVGCEGRLCAGSAAVDITPPVGTPMWGYGSRSGVLSPTAWFAQKTGATTFDTDLYAKAFLASEGIHQRLFARAVVLQDADGDRVALTQLDLGSVSGALHQAVAERVADVGIARTHLLLAPSHTHAGPGALHANPFHWVGFGDVYDPRVVGALADAIAAAIVAATGELAPAAVAVGRDTIEDATRNRAFEAYLRNPEADPDATPGTAINRTLTMIRADTLDGEPLGAFSVFPNHGTVQGADQLLLSGDNAGYAARLLEETMARSGGEPVAAWANGEEGDVSPVAEGEDSFDASEDNGHRQADPAIALWESLGEELTDQLDIAVTYDAATMSDGTAAGYDMSPSPIYGLGGSCLPASLPGVGAKCPMAPAGPPPTWMPFQMIALGDDVLVALPWEITTVAGERIRGSVAEAAGRALEQVAIVGLANEYGGYLTTPEEYELQGYEGQMTWWGPEQADWIRDRAGSVAAGLVTGTSGTPPYADGPPTSPDVSPASQVAAALRNTPGTIVTEPNATVRGEVAAVTWDGGDPTVDARRAGTVVLERQLGSGWVEVDRDGPGSVLLRFLRTADANHWTAEWRSPATAVPGTYRFRIAGQAFAGVDAAPYEVTSAPFELSSR